MCNPAGLIKSSFSLGALGSNLHSAVANNSWFVSPFVCDKCHELRINWILINIFFGRKWVQRDVVTLRSEACVSVELNGRKMESWSEHKSEFFMIFLTIQRKVIISICLLCCWRGEWKRAIISQRSFLSFMISCEYSFVFCANGAYWAAKMIARRMRCVRKIPHFPFNK